MILISYKSLMQIRTGVDIIEVNRIEESINSLGEKF